MSLLIITSTVNVNSCLTVLIDPKVRLEQYIDSILFYLKSKVIDKIIVCDNSGFDYSGITEIYEQSNKNSKIIEFLNFQGTVNKIQKYGKGFGEGEIMSFVFNNSKLITHEELSFLKVTGRLKILNVDTILESVKPNTNYFQAVNLNPFVNLKKVDTRFYQCTKQNFNFFLENCYKKVNDSDGFFLEHVYYDKLIEEKIEFERFRILPNFLGISGSTGGVYKMSYSEFWLRQILYTMFNGFKN